MAKGLMPSLDQFVAVLTVARLGSFTRAAQELEISQPALSRKIMGFEKELGVRLFDRIGRAIRLTASGEDLVTRIGPLIEELTRTTRDLASATRTTSGRLRLGATESIAVNCLPTILRPFLGTHRRISLRLVCRTSDRLPAMVANGDLDIAICAIEADLPGLSCHPLWDEEMVLVLPIGHSARSRSVTSYLEDDFILLPPTTVTRRLLDRSLLAQGHGLNVVFEHESSEVIKAMVAVGLGLAILPETTVRKETRRGELAAWPLTDLRVVRRIVAITDPNRGPWPAEQALLSALERYGR